MTAKALAFAGVDSWRGSASNDTQPRRTYSERYAYDQPVPTFGRERSYASRVDALTRLVELARKAPQVQPAALIRVGEWLTNLPGAVPNPFVAIGEDGSISTEWDIGGRSLHITFEGDTEEVYFFSPDGEEWESTLDAIDKVTSAMRSIAIAAAARG